MTIQLKVWTKEGKTRVYMNTRFTCYQLGMRDAEGSYFYEGENGETRAHFKPCFSGRYGEAVKNVRQYCNIPANLPFADLMKRLDEAKTKTGNFSESKYFKLLAKIA